MSDEGLYDRQGDLVDLELIQSLHICIAGCGAIGANCALALLLTGFTQITFVDFDTVSRSNCSRAAGLFDPALDTGRHKAVVLAERMRRWNPACKASALVADVRDLGRGFFLQFDAVYCGLDNTEALVALGAACAGTGIPIFRSATHRMNSSVEVVGNRPGGSCLCCHRHNLPRETRVTSCGVQYLADIAASRTPTMQLSSAIGANRLVMQHLLRLSGKGQPGDIRLYDTGSALQKLHLTPDETCPCHGREPAFRQLSGSIHDTTLASALNQIRWLTGEEHTLHAHDDFILYGRCGRCGETYPIYTPLRKLRAGVMHCPHCPPVEQPDHGEGLAVFSPHSAPEVLEQKLDALGFRYADLIVSRCADRFESWYFPGDLAYLDSLQKEEAT